MNTKLRCAVVGPGPIELEITQSAWTHPQIDLCAAVDVSQNLVGKRLYDIAPDTVDGDVRVDPSLAPKFDRDSLDVVFHATGSRVVDVDDPIAELLARGVNVVSTCEELVFPWARHQEAAEMLHRAAVEGNSTVVAAGVNPGFAMDLLPLVLASATSRVDSVELTRVTDVGVRRAPLQAKMGVGISEEEFWRRNGDGQIGHVGLGESLLLLADVLGWKLSSENVTQSPILADGSTEGAGRGTVLGVRHLAEGSTVAGNAIRMRLDMFVGADSCDTIEISASPSIRMVAEGGLSGDSCTSAVIVNLASACIAAPACLSTVADLRRVRPVLCGTARSA